MSSNRPQLMILPGDGVGPEVIREAEKVLAWLEARRGLALDVKPALMGVDSYRKWGKLLTDETLADALAADAILFGAQGGPDYDDIPVKARREGGLLRLRKELGLFANLRPVQSIAALADVAPLKREVSEGVDMLILRELTGGVYFGEPRGIEVLPDGSERGINTQIYTTAEIRRIGHVAFQLARRRRKAVCSVDKANVMESGALWRREMQKLHDAEYADVELRHMYADNCAMQLILNPRQFDVVVTDNLFGDVLSDGAGAIMGSLGMLPSASLNGLEGPGKRRGLYEPVHGSAPDIAGQGKANPTGAILSLALALRHSFAREADAALIEQAVRGVIGAGIRTRDIAAAGSTAVTTAAMGDAVVAALDRIAG